MATVVKDIFPATILNTSSRQVALDQTAPTFFFDVVLLKFFALFFWRIINLLRILNKAALHLTRVEIYNWKSFLRYQVL